MDNDGSRKRVAGRQASNRESPAPYVDITLSSAGTVYLLFLFLWKQWGQKHQKCMFDRESVTLCGPHRTATTGPDAGWKLPDNNLHHFGVVNNHYRWKTDEIDLTMVKSVLCRPIELTKLINYDYFLTVQQQDNVICQELRKIGCASVASRTVL